MSPLLLLAGAATLLLVSRRKAPSKHRSSDIVCPPLVPGEGQIAGYDYLEFATGGATLEEELPIIIFFHSRGTSPKSLAKHIQQIPSRARVVMPLGPEGSRSNPMWWSLRAKTEDQSGLAEQMKAESESMVRFVEAANHCLGGVGKPIVTGHSQGGMMTFAVAAADPSKIKIAIPVAGWLPTELWPHELPPTYAIHGSNDRTVDFSRTEDFAQRAGAAGLPIEFHSIPGHGHGLGGSLRGYWLDLVNWAVSQ